MATKNLSLITIPYGAVGQVDYDGLDWATIIAGAGNDSRMDTTPSALFRGDGLTDKWDYLFRAVLTANVSSIPDTVIVSDIVESYVRITGLVSFDEGTNSPALNIYDASPGVALDDADYANIGSTPYSSQIAQADFVVGGFNYFYLNLDGKTALIAALAGDLFSIGAREANYDVAGVAPVWKARGNCGFSLSAPRLIVTYKTLPLVVNNAAYNITSTKATLEGWLVDDGELACETRFQYGETDAYGTDTAWVATTEGDSPTVNITGLTRNTTYHWRTQARNDKGTSSASDETFMTHSGGSQILFI